MAAEMLCIVFRTKLHEKVVLLMKNGIFSDMSEKIHKIFTESIVKIALVLAGGISYNVVTKVTNSCFCCHFC